MIDTIAKRSSAMSLVPWAAMLPPADSAIDQDDRQQLALRYRGIPANVAAVGAHGHLTLTYYLPHTLTLGRI